MTEFQELIQDAPNFVSMERGELVAYAYGMFAAGTKANAENESLRELVRWMYGLMDESCAVQHPYAPAPISYDRLMQALARARELGVEVDE